MIPPSIDVIRNIGIMAHIDAGKTTVSERILFYTGLIRKMGEVHEGTALMDWMKTEQERGITISCAATCCFWKGTYINLIDTPGHVDFIIEVERALRVLDGAVAVFDSVHGVEPQSEMVWKQADFYQIPRICFLNKIDRVGASFDKSFLSIKNKLSLKPIAIQMPIGKEEHFKGVIDLIEKKMLFWNQDKLGKKYSVLDITPEYKTRVDKKHQDMLEQLAEEDEILMDKYLNNKTIVTQDIHDALKRQTLNMKITPVLCGSALKNKGIQLLLSAIQDYLPSPTEIPSIKAKDHKGHKYLCKASSAEPLACLVFKIAFDSFSGTLTYVRVYSGILKTGQQVYNSREGKTERVQKILKMHSNNRKEISELKAGDIGAIVGLKYTQTGDSLCHKNKIIFLKSLSFPTPVLSVAIEPKSDSDQIKIEDTLNKIKREDPSCQIKKDPETGQILLMGMGELHIEILLDKLLTDYKMSARVGKPQVSFREQPASCREEHGVFDQNIQGKQQQASLTLKIEPQNQSTRFDDKSSKFIFLEDFIFERDFVNKTQASDEILQSLKTSLFQAITAGPLMAYPIRGLRVSLLDLQYQEGTSLQVISSCFYQTFSKAMMQAKSLLLEPVFLLHISLPGSFTGAVIADLNKRGGQVKNLEKQKHIQIITATAPLNRLFGYATDLRSLSQGRASFSMKMHDYQQVSDKDKNKLLI